MATHDITLDKKPSDFNKYVSDLCKSKGWNLKDDKILLSVKSESNRIWIKYPGETSVTAYG